MSTNAAVQPEIDALTRLKEAGVIIGFTFEGHPSPRFLVDLNLGWDAAANDWTKEGKEREAILDQVMEDLEWAFDDYARLPGSDVERQVYKFHGQARPAIPGGHYRCVVVSGGDADAWDIQADSPIKAAKSFVDDNFEPSSQTAWVHVRVQSPDGDESTHKIEVKPVASPCINQGGHLWLDPRYRASGAGVLVEETCDHCGLKKNINTGSRDPVDGLMVTVLSYTAR